MHTGEKHFNVINVTRVSHKNQILCNITEHILVRNHFTVVSVTRVSHQDLFCWASKSTHWFKRWPRIGGSPADARRHMPKESVNLTKGTEETNTHTHTQKHNNKHRHYVSRLSPRPKIVGLDPGIRTVDWSPDPFGDAKNQMSGPIRKGGPCNRGSPWPSETFLLTLQSRPGVPPSRPVWGRWRKPDFGRPPCRYYRGYICQIVTNGKVSISPWFWLVSQVCATRTKDATCFAPR